MGYNTDFTGKLEFTSEPSVAVIRKLKSILGEDCRDHPEWNSKDLTYIDFKITDDMDGIEWDDSCEKTYMADGLIDMVIGLMRQDFPDFGLKGELLAQGEEYDDRWRLVIGADGLAHRVEFPRIGDRVTCPFCEKEFTVGDDK